LCLCAGVWQVPSACADGQKWACRQAGACVACRQAGARVQAGRCPMHEGRCPCMWAGARAGRQVPVQAGRCPHRGAGAWCCTGEWYILFKPPHRFYIKIHLLVVVTTSLSTVLLDPERLLGEVGTHVLESSAGAGGCWRVLADAASSGGPGGHLTEPGGPRRSPADADGHGGRGRQWRTRRTVADTAGARDVADTADEADMVATKGTVRTCVIQKVAGAGDDTEVATGRWQVGVREELTTLHVVYTTVMLNLHKAPAFFHARAHMFSACMSTCVCLVAGTCLLPAQPNLWHMHRHRGTHLLPAPAPDRMHGPWSAYTHLPNPTPPTPCSLTLSPHPNSLAETPLRL